jgi:hypothetical protein
MDHLIRPLQQRLRDRQAERFVTVLRLDERRRWGRKDGAGRETGLLVEQNARMALSIASTTYVMKAGTIALEGSSAASACTSERPTWAVDREVRSRSVS